MTLTEFKAFQKNIMSCPLFKNMSPEEIEKLLIHGDTKFIEAADGDELDESYMYVILDGRVSIEKPASDGRYVGMLVAEAPAPINVATAFANESGRSRFTVQNSAAVLAISGKTIREAIEKGGAFAVNVAAFLTNRIGFLNKKIISLAGYSATSRLNMYIEENREGNELTIPMSLTDFAEYLGVGRASLYRTLDAMESSGQIRRKGRKIELL